MSSLDDFDYVYDREGKPISLKEWSRLRAEAGDDYVIVQKTKIGESEVSTVWLGIDHGFGRTHAPMIFETMIFGGELDGEVWRYSTEEQARAGHAEVSVLTRAAEALKN